MKLLKVGFSVFLLFALVSCGGKKFKKTPVDDFVKDMPTNRVFSVILHDMDVEGTFFHEYHHQYKIIQEREPGKPEEEVTAWFEVSKEFFERNIDNMGMELVSRGEDGKLQKGATPPGYNNYVGNTKYGSWQNSGGSSFWAFYGQYAFMSSLFRMGTYPVRRSYYDDYRTSYRGTGRGYYGPTTGGRSTYGTNSDFGKSTNTNSAWGRNTSRFKQRVTSRTSRSSSRYGGSSSRSRGGGFGK